MKNLIVVAIALSAFIVLTAYGYTQDSGDVVTIPDADIRVIVMQKKTFYAAVKDDYTTIICNNLRASKDALVPIGISSSYPTKHDVKATGDMDEATKTLFSKTCYIK